MRMCICENTFFCKLANSSKQLSLKKKEREREDYKFILSYNFWSFSLVADRLENNLRKRFS